MKYDAKFIIEVSGGLAVLLSLIFVGLQLQQGNIIAEREARSEITSLSMELNRIIFEDPNNAYLYAKLRSSQPTLDSQEAELADGLARLYSNYFGALNSVVESDLIPDEIVNVYVRIVRTTLKDHPGLCPFMVEEFPNLGSGVGFRIIETVQEELAKLNCQPWTFE